MFDDETQADVTAVFDADTRLIVITLIGDLDHDNMIRVDFIDPTGFGQLVPIHHSTRTALIDRRVHAVIDPRQHVAGRALGLTGIDTLFTIHRDVTTACTPSSSPTY